MHATLELLTKEEYQIMARVCKDAWVNGMKGLFFGSLFRCASHFAGKSMYANQ